MAQAAAYFGPGWQLLQHVNQVYQSRELVLGILHHTTAAQLDAAARVCQKVEKRLRESDQPDRRVTGDEERALQQLLQTMQFPAVTHKGTIRKVGQSVVTMLLTAVYGQISGAGKTVVDTIAFGPMSKAAVFRQACIAVLKKCICSSNCFTLMSVGRGAGCEELIDQTVLYALADFTQCTQHDMAGFCQLDDGCLMRLLRNTHLQASSDKVVEALIAWVQFAPGARQELLPSLLESTAALERLDDNTLRGLNAHPMVAVDAECQKVVADAYIRRCLVSGKDERSTLLAH